MVVSARGALWGGKAEGLPAQQRQVGVPYQAHLLLSQQQCAKDRESSNVCSAHNMCSAMHLTVSAAPQAPTPLHTHKHTRKGTLPTHASPQPCPFHCGPHSQRACSSSALIRRLSSTKA